MSEALANQTTFDYSALEDEVRRDVIAERNDIRQRQKQAAEDIVAIGKSLIAVKSRLPHGQFGTWLSAEFGWSQDTAGRFMAVAKTFGENPQIADFAPSALYALASNSVPQEIRDQFLEQAENGETVRYWQVKQVIKNQPEPIRVRVTHVPREPEPPIVMAAFKVIDRNEQEEQPSPPLLSIVDLETGEVVNSEEEEAYTSELAPVSYPDGGDTRAVLEQMRVDIRRDLAWLEGIDFEQLSPRIQVDVRKELDWVRRAFIRIEDITYVDPEDRV